MGKNWAESPCSAPVDDVRTKARARSLSLGKSEFHLMWEVLVMRAKISPISSVLQNTCPLRFTPTMELVLADGM